MKSKESSRLAMLSRLTLAGTVAAGLLATASVASAQPAQSTPSNVVQLSASSSVEVPQDYLTITLAATQDGADAKTVQTKLKSTLDSALTQAKSASAAGQLEVRTGDFSLSPRYDRNGKITGWQGRSELVIHGRDFGRIGTVAGALDNMAINDVSFSLSREGREKVEHEAQAQAIERFKTRADEIAKSFGFSRYSLREVSVNANGGNGYSPRPRAVMMAASSAKMEDAAVPVEAGKSTVTVTVSGSVQLQ